MSAQDRAGDTGRDRPPRSFLRADLEVAGFVGWRTWAELRATDLAEVPCNPGAYLVFRPSDREPQFVHPSPAGSYQGRDPTVSVERLRDREPDAHVVYIGKADYRKRRNRLEALRRRLGEYGRFGGGEDDVAHYGGRFVWQLADSDGHFPFRGSRVPLQDIACRARSGEGPPSTVVLAGEWVWALIREAPGRLSSRGRRSAPRLLVDAMKLGEQTPPLTEHGLPGQLLVGREPAPAPFLMVIPTPAPLGSW